ncbi:MAG: sulfate adenylyltransferase subunit CysN [Pseudomonadales bacterium]
MSHQSELISQDIERYLKQHENKELLRLLTCGSVDDGKSTLIGRLLHDSKMIYEDQLAAIEKDNTRVGNAGDDLDLALLVDGLQAEREQGITIDVAYRYFSTDKRKFIIADTPGHEQYTRNMATGASNCNLAIILVDARHGVQVQTRRHSFIASQLGIAHTIVAINKMDLVDFSEQRYNEIVAQYRAFAAELNLNDLHFIPLSALKGDNVVNPSDSMPWYRGEPLLSTLENIELASDVDFETLRFPVQYVNRPNLDFRGYCGTLTSGVVRKGDHITAYPSGKQSKVASIVTFDGELEEAYPPMSVTLTLEDEIDISRGDIITHATDDSQIGDRFKATLVWMSEKPLSIGSRYDVKLLTGRSSASITHIEHKIDVNTLQKQPGHSLALNEIALCELKLERPIVLDTYRELPGTGSFIVVDRLSNATVAAGMIEEGKQQNTANALIDSPAFSAIEKAARFGQQPAHICLEGLSDEALNTVLFSLEKALIESGRSAAVIAPGNQPEVAFVQRETLLANGFLVLTGKTAENPDKYSFNLENETLNSGLINSLMTQLKQKNLI